MHDQKSVSLLIGSGFSVNAGYPTGYTLSKRIENFDEDDWGFAPNGQLCDSRVRDHSPIHKDKLDSLAFLKQIIHFYCSNFVNAQHRFNYEEFYDYLCHEAVKNNFLISMWNLFPSREEYHVDFEKAINDATTIFNQLIEKLLVDSDGKNAYEECRCVKTISEYEGFLECIKSWRLHNYRINIHTLNHDLWMERLNHTEAFAEKLDEGVINDNQYFCQKLNGEIKGLCHFSDTYTSDIRLYKLHGSLDYFKFYHGYTDRYDILKKDRSIDNTEVYQVINGVKESCATNFHGTFLTGTTEKIRHYGEEPFVTLINSFCKNLEKADMLIMIGYGGYDDEINKLIASHFDKQKPLYVVVPFDSWSGQAHFEGQTNLKVKLVKANTKDMDYKCFSE